MGSDFAGAAVLVVLVGSASCGYSGKLGVDASREVEKEMKFPKSVLWVLIGVWMAFSSYISILFVGFFSFSTIISFFFYGVIIEYTPIRTFFLLSLSLNSFTCFQMLTSAEIQIFYTFVTSETIPIFLFLMTFGFVAMGVGLDFAFGLLVNKILRHYRFFERVGGFRT